MTRPIHPIGYLFCLVPLSLPWLGVYCAMQFGPHTAFMWWTILMVFGALPLLDAYIGRNSVNVDEAATAAIATQALYRWLTLLCLPLQYLSVFAGAWWFFRIDSTAQAAAWIISIGVVSSITAINVAHELIHKSSKLEQWAGGMLLASVCYGGFKVEHLRGHHVHVSTPQDASSARLGQSLYGFWLQAVVRNVANAFLLESGKLAHKNQRFWSYHNELLWWFAGSFSIALIMSIAWGLAGLVFFIGQSFVAILLLETINYIEHYGLQRKVLSDGRFERVTHHHSWNANFLLSNFFLLQLQRHSDHHAFPKRRYPVLRHFDDSPQLPAGYATLVLVALIPPLWRRLMDSRVDQYYASVNNTNIDVAKRS